MAGINGWVFAAVGAMIAGVVYFFVNELWAFYYVAAAFVLYGILKVFLKSIVNFFKNKKKSKKQDISHSRQHTLGHYQQNYENAINPGQTARRSQHSPQDMHDIHHHTNYHSARSNHPNEHAGHRQHSAHPRVKQQHPQANPVFCRNCGERLRLHDNFCSRCGIKQQ